MPSVRPQACQPSFTAFPDAKRATELPNRAEQSDFLDVFGRSRRRANTPCVCETRVEPNLSQVLYLLFSPELQRNLANPQGTAAQLCKAGKPAGEIVNELYLRTVPRPPTPSELGDAVASSRQPPKKKNRQSSKTCCGRC